MQKRGMALFLAALMVWALTVPAWGAVNPFSDLEPDHWAYEAVVKLAAAGLVEGYPDGTFGGDRNFTRYEMAMVFARILARFERLIDQKVDEGIGAQTKDLNQLIKETRDELSEVIETNYDQLSAAVARLNERMDALDKEAANQPQASAGQQSSAGGELTDAAKAALSQLVAKQLAEKLKGLAQQEDVDALAKRLVEAEARLSELESVKSDLSGVQEDVAANAGDLTMVKGKVGDLQQDMESVKGDLSGVKEDLSNVEGDLDGVKGELSNVKEDVAANAGDLTIVKGKVGDVQEQVDQVSQDLSDKANASDVDDLARRVLRLEGSTPSRTEARLIAEKAIADALADQQKEVKAALAAAQGDMSGLNELVDEKVSQLGDRIDQLADEFRPELERLGVKVAELEKRINKQEAAQTQLSHKVDLNTAKIDANSASIARQGGDIKALQDISDNVVITGKSETTFEQTSIIAEPGVAAFYHDPRDTDSKKYEAGNDFNSKVTFGMEAEPADNVNVKAELILDDLFGGVDTVKPSANLDVTTPGVVRSLHAGELDSENVAAPFDKYTLDADKFDDSDYEQGASTHVVFGYRDSTDVNGFVSRYVDDVSSDTNTAFGASASYTLSEQFDLAFRGVKETTLPNGSTTGVPQLADSAVEFQSSGKFAALTYSAKAVNNNDADPDSALEGTVEVPLLFTTAKLETARVGADFNPTFGKDLDSGSNDWLDRRLDPPDDWVQAGESDSRATLSTPLFGVDTAVTAGRRTDAGVAQDTNSYTQVEVSGVHFAGLDAGALYDRRINDSAEVDNTVRANLETSLLGADVKATVHNRDNAQAWATAGPVNEADQRSTWITATKDVDLILPLTIDGRYAMNQTLGENSPKLGVSTGFDLGQVHVTAGYSTEQNALGDVDDDVSKTWWKNAEWSKGVTGNDKRDTAKLGFDYTLKGFFGTDIDTGYEYRIVNVNNAPYGTARNTFKASFEKSLRGGEATLAGEGKLVTGGLPLADRDGNDSDMSAKLTLTYPVFEGADLTLGGAVVNSTGTGPDYSVYNLNAGLTVEF